MDYSAIIQVLREEMERIEQAIANLESLGSPAEPPKRRGRKSMGPEERKRVAERMKRYWAGRKKPPK